MLRYRLALDLGTSSIGWCALRLDESDSPIAIIRAGVRIFSDGRNAKDGASLAVTRRLARQMRRRRDRLLRRKARLMEALVRLGFFPKEESRRRALVDLDPYSLRARGLDASLSPEEFARAAFHLNQRRGFKSNRRTDKKEEDRGALKAAIATLRASIRDDGCRTVGEWLAARHAKRLPLRARYRTKRVTTESGKARIEKSYDLYIDRQMIEEEFDALWASQAKFEPSLFNDAARVELKDILLFQRKLRPVTPGRCTFIPAQERAPLALPTAQRFRIHQELANLRWIDDQLVEHALSPQQRAVVADALDARPEMTFKAIAKVLGLPASAKFNLESARRDRLKGNATAVELAKAELLAEKWRGLDDVDQDALVARLIGDENEQQLVRWLEDTFGLDEARAERVAKAGLVDGYGNVSLEAASRIVVALRDGATSYAEAVVAAGFQHHSALGHVEQTGELMAELPYYGSILQRHVGFGTGVPTDTDEKRYGRIANPTVHVGLNQVRKVVNDLITHYGRPTEVVVEVARELKYGAERRKEIEREQAERQKQNDQWAAQFKELTGHDAKPLDIQRFRLWADLNPTDALDRRCPYTGAVISLQMLLSSEVEVDHILPFSRTLDDSLNNKTIALRRANRDKGNRTPWEAFGQASNTGYDYDAILQRATRMPREKAKRFATDGYARWLKEDKDFLARALTDTAYLSRITREYLGVICETGRVRVIPGRLTALLRGKFGLNDVLGTSGAKNRHDHRHHAVDAAVIGVTDQGLLQRFAQASASAREHALGRLVESMPLPWPTYREHVARAINAITVSHRPDHNHEGRLHNETAYGLREGGLVHYTRVVDGKPELVTEKLAVIPIAEPNQSRRHGVLPDGSPKPYKGYKGDSNYCIEVVADDKGIWKGWVVTTFAANQIAVKHGAQTLRNPKQSVSGRPLVMRLMRDDYVRVKGNAGFVLWRLAVIKGDGRMLFCEPNEANVDARDRDRTDEFTYTVRMASGLQKAGATRVTVSPAGFVNRK